MKKPRPPIRRALLPVLLLALAAPAGGDEGPVFRNVHHMDAEYELDRRMAETPGDARDAFLSAENAYRIAGGSLNIRHLFLAEDLKLRFPLVAGRFWLRFRHGRRQGLERDDRAAAIELEWSPARRWFLSLVGEPAFHKAAASAGAAVRWGASEAKGLRLAWLWPGFDNNYAFSNRSVNEGFDRFYRRAPAEARLSAVWVDGPLSASLEARLARGWERATRTFATGVVESDAGGGGEGGLDLRWRTGDWTFLAEGEYWRDRRERRNEPALLPSDRAVRAERGMARAGAERLWSGAWRGRLAAALVAQRGRAAHAADPARDDGYKIVDRLYEAALFQRAGRAEWEYGYLYDRQRWEVRSGFGTDGAPRSHNRFKAGWRFDFSGSAWIKAAAAVELDRTGSEAFFSFDGGTVLLQTAF